MSFFYCQDFSAGLIAGEEFQHLKAFRLESGDEVTLIDGCGNFAQVRLSHKTKASQSFELLDQGFIPKPTFGLHLLIAPTKSMERMEWLCEKLVELGIQQITFIFAQFSERRKLDLDRMRRIAIAALKQSRQFWLPKLDCQEFSDSFLSGLGESKRLVLDQTGLPIQKLGIAFQANICFAVGPEGGWSPKEFEILEHQHFQKTKVSDAVLRTETAGLMGAMALLLLKP
jgi:16S rRNA (uracil1498-N3)-methyltransferase